MTHPNVCSYFGRHEVFGPIPIKEVAQFDGACPQCGDSIQSESVVVRDHGKRRRILLAWCADCKRVHGNTVGDLL